MSKKSKEKRKLLKLTPIIEDGKIPEYDIFQILDECRFDTKPNMAKLLKQYVISIRACTSDKFDFWPKINYTLLKVLVTFSNDVTIIQDNMLSPSVYYMQKGIDEVKMTTTQSNKIAEFFNFLYAFRFILQPGLREFDKEMHKVTKEKCINDAEKLSALISTPEFRDNPMELSVTTLPDESQNAQDGFQNSYDIIV